MFGFCGWCVGSTNRIKIDEKPKPSLDVLVFDGRRSLQTVLHSSRRRIPNRVQAEIDPRCDTTLVRGRLRHFSDIVKDPSERPSIGSWYSEFCSRPLSTENGQRLFYQLFPFVLRHVTSSPTIIFTVALQRLARRQAATPSVPAPSRPCPQA